jgi:hypothetical protein
MDNQLYHYGVLGMHWGRRLGSATRYESARRSGLSKSDARKKIETENITTAKSVTDASSSLAKEGLKVHRAIGDVQRARRMEDLSSLTDDELKAKINRMNLEQQYSNLSASKVSKGQVYAKSTLEVAGSVLAVGSSALGIALAVKQLKG